MVIRSPSMRSTNAFTHYAPRARARATVAPHHHRLSPRNRTDNRQARPQFAGPRFPAKHGSQSHKAIPGGLTARPRDDDRRHSPLRAGSPGHAPYLQSCAAHGFLLLCNHLFCVEIGREPSKDHVHDFGDHRLESRRLVLGLGRFPDAANGSDAAGRPPAKQGLSLCFDAERDKGISCHEKPREPKAQKSQGLD